MRWQLLLPLGIEIVIIILFMRLEIILQNKAGSGNEVGLVNVHKRLQAVYGSTYGLKIESQPGEGTTVTLNMPLTSAREDKVV